MTNPIYHHRRQLRPNARAVPATSTNAEEEQPNDNDDVTYAKSALTLMGYDKNGDPIYDEPCYSNDNPDPHKTNCTKSPTPTPGSEAQGLGKYNTPLDYTYECTENGRNECNVNTPGNTQDVGWTYVGQCLTDVDCPDRYDESGTIEYEVGDLTSVSSDVLNDQVLTFISCPNFVDEETGEIDEEDKEANDNDDENTVIVSYAYKVESARASNAGVFLPRLEEQILLNLATDMCDIEEEDDVGFVVTGIQSTPDDTPVNVPCTVTSADADSCFVINGRLTITLSPLDDPAGRTLSPLDDPAYDPTAASADAATDSTQSNLQDAMTNDELLSPDMPEVVKVEYLGDGTYDWESLPISHDSMPINGSGNNDQVKTQAAIAGGIVGGLLLALLALLLVTRRRKSKWATESKNGRGYDVNEQYLDDGLDRIINNIDCTNDKRDQRNFVVDPPGAFHLGNHHYTKDGVRYFSPLCEQCLAARAEADGAELNDMGDDMSLTYSDSDLSYNLDRATKFADINEKDLGRYHSSMHVRHCKSTTCDICIKEKGVQFVKARKELAHREAML